ncbi:MAG: flagellar assembly protein FliH [Spirochaetia bacterium]
MARNVFRAQEVQNVPRKVYIEPPKEQVEEPEEVESLEEYQGPSVEDIRKEIEQYRKNWETEKASMIAQAREEADKIVKDAEQVAFEEVKKKNNQAQKVKQQAEDEANRIRLEAEAEAEQMKQKAQARVQEIEKEAHEKGFSQGREEGFEAGKGEAERLVERVHVVLSKAIEKRNEIIEQSETQLINLVLLIAKKVIKVISENQKNVVINNVIQALRKLKSRGDVVIRVNLADVDLTNEHMQDFMRMVEDVKSITILEDSSVDRGGCIIETDFGQIDARISSQLNEIEEKIIELMPIKAKGEQ